METHNKHEGQPVFENYIVYAVLLILPLVVYSSFSNSFVIPKLAFLTFFLGLILIIKSVRGIAKNSISFSASALDLPVLLIGASYVAGTIFQTPNKMEALLLPGTAVMVVAGVLLFFVVNQMGKHNKAGISYVLFASSVLVAMVVLMSATGIFKSIPGLPSFMQQSAFSTLGGPLPALIYMISLAPVGLSMLIGEKNDMLKKSLAGISLVVVALASILTIINILPGRDTTPQLPGFNTSWIVAVDSLKQNPLLGVGPGNYLTAFNRFRPISYNATDLWSTRFTSGQSFAFTLVTETGVLGAAALLLIIIIILKFTRDFANNRDPKDWMAIEGASLISLIIIAASMLLFPVTISILAAFFTLLAVVTATSPLSINLFNKEDKDSIPFAARLPILLATLPVIIAVTFYGFQASRVLSADYTYKKALDAVVANDGRRAYDTLQKAINQNPYVDRYRVSYAQINLILANAIAQNENIADSDRQAIAQLVQQAIREGKVAVALNPQRAGNWEVLGSIYRAVMPLAQGADVFAVQTYSQAVALDPLNVNTRIALGGIYYSAKAYEDAIDVFKLAVAVKPDFANAHYNLAVAYRENGSLDKAIQSMGIVLSLVNKDSEDFKVATQALEDMQNKRSAQTPEGGNLTSPDSNQLPELDEPLELPEDAAPPEEARNQDTAVPTTEPSASPTASPLP